MGTALTGLEIRDTYDALIKVTDNGPLSGTAKYLSDGLGNDSVLALSTAQVGIGSTTLGTNYPLTIRSATADYTKMLDWGTGAGGSWGNLTVNINSPYETILTSGEWAFKTGSTERMRITSAGNVGIGTSSPTQKLHVYEASAASQAYLLVQNNRTRNAAVYTKTTAGGFYAGTSIGTDTLCYQIYDDVAGERMRIDSSGNVGIGNSAPTAKLDVTGTLAVSGATTLSSSATIGSSAYVGTAGIATIKTNSTILGATSELGLLIANDGTLNDLAQIGFGYSESRSAAVIAGIISTASGSTTSDLLFATRSGTVGSVAPTERLRITSAGNVGIGTSSPATKLEVNEASGGAQVTISGIASTEGAILNLKNRAAKQFSADRNIVQIDNYLYDNASTTTGGMTRIKSGHTASGVNSSFISFSTSPNDGNLTEHLRIDSSGNVGIGTSSPSYKLDVSGISSSNTGFLISSGQYDNIGQTPYTGMFMTGSSSTDGFGALLLTSRTDLARPIIFGTSNGSISVERVRIDANGLKFNGDTAAANALDDYEEGTWTPVFTSTGATFTYLGQGGAYTKIGRQVFAQFYLRTTATGTLTNTVSIDGLPFTSLNSPLVQGSAAVWYTGTKSVTPLNAVNSTTINLWVNNVSIPALLLASDVSSGEYLVGTLTYFV